MKMLNRYVRPLIVLIASAASIVSATAAEPAAPSGMMRRLSADQYRNIVSDVFGSHIKFNGRFEPDIREAGLQAIGSTQVSVTGTGLEQYNKMALTISKIVLSPENRSPFFDCAPKAETDADDACARQYLSSVGKLLYRRPLSAKELDLEVGVASAGARELHSFYGGLEHALTNLLMSPQFLFRIDAVAINKSGKVELDSYSKASRLSFLLWNAGPDLELLRAAGKGELESPRGLEKQVNRMIASPRLQTGVRAFFRDMLAFDQFDTLAKDTTIYPKFDVNVVKDAREQTLRTLADLLVVRNQDYRDIFTSRKTFMTPILATVYDISLPRNGAANGEPDQWQPYEFPSDDLRAGILMQVSFVALHAHEGRSSPTIRGKALRELVLCQKVPDPPGNVEFKIVQDTTNPLYKTARERLAAHATNPVCAGCHKLVDPIGLAMENFDGGGGYQTSENGAPIDTSGELDGVKFKDAAGLGQAVHDSPATTSCAVSRMAGYALGRRLVSSDDQWIADLKKGFGDDEYRVPAFLRRIALSPQFYGVTQ